jgi:hypothetical protein
MNFKFAKRRSDREDVELPFETEKPTINYDEHVHDIIQEKSNSTPQVGSPLLLIQYYEKYKDDPHYLITYSNTPVVATNYKSYSSGRYNTPPGYYAYPLKELGEPTTSFAKDYEYIILTRITTDKILNLSDYTEQDFQNDIQRLKSLADPEVVEESIGNNIQYTIYNIAQKLGSNFKQSTLYMKLGYNVVIDPGLGVLHRNELRQTVVFAPRSDLDLIGIFVTEEDIKATKRKALIMNPNEEMQLKIISQDGLAIKEIIKLGIIPSKAVQLAAVKDNGHAIQFIKNPSEEVQVAAVKKYGDAIVWIKNPSEVVQLAAVQDEGAISYIINKGIIPSKAVQLASIMNHPLSIGWLIEAEINVSEELELIAINRNPMSIGFIKNPNETLQLAAVNKKGSEGWAIEFIVNPCEAAQLIAIEKDASYIRYIKPQSAITPKVLELYKEKTGKDYKIANKYHKLLKLAKSFSYN